MVVVAQAATKDAMDQVAQCSAKLEANNSELSASKEEVKKLKSEVEEFVNPILDYMFCDVC